MKTLNVFVLFILLMVGSLRAQFPPAFSEGMLQTAEVDSMVRVYLSPQRILWKSSEKGVQNTDVLMKKGEGQAWFGKQPLCRISNVSGETSGLILDFGIELHGGLQITTAQGNNVNRNIRIRFGESVSEVNSTAKGVNFVSGGRNATNHHAMRDFTLMLPGYGTIEIGNTGFRFVRIDLLDVDAYVLLKEVRAVAVYRDLPYLGSFRCSDTRLNRIWETGAYTVHLNMQSYLIDGIKRDRMVWAGDMHPELMTINYVFGYNEIVPKTLDFLKDKTPLPAFMNGIPSYSMWWVLMQYDWYLFHGRIDYLNEQKSYLISLLDVLSMYVDAQGAEQLHNVGMRFIDWPTYGNEVAVHAGLQSMMVMTFEKGAALCDFMDEAKLARKYRKLVERMKQYQPEAGGSKQSAALLSLSEIKEAVQLNQDVLAIDRAKRFSAFFGYYMLEAQAKAGDYTRAMQNIRDFWGGMLDLGATTFWEEFDLDEAAGSARIDEWVGDGQKDYHNSTGKECYIGLRRSLCHGWASGPTPWLSRHVLGVRPLVPGGIVIEVKPNLGDLTWVEGSYPTAYGTVLIRHDKQPDGTVISRISAPKEVRIVQD